jgi:hypothetical protein
MNGQLITTEQLLAVTGYSRPGDVCRSLGRQGIWYHLGEDGIHWTTIDLVNAGAGLARGGPAAEMYTGNIMDSETDHIQTMCEAALRRSRPLWVSHGGGGKIRGRHQPDVGKS